MILVDNECVGGLAFVVEGALRVAGACERDDWLGSLPTAPAPRNDRLAEAWARDGRTEHASIVSRRAFRD